LAVLMQRSFEGNQAGTAWRLGRKREGGQ